MVGLAEKVEDCSGNLKTFREIVDDYSDLIKDMGLPPEKEIKYFANAPHFFDIDFPSRFFNSISMGPVILKEELTEWRDSFKEVSTNEVIDYKCTIAKLDGLIKATDSLYSVWSELTPKRTFMKLYREMVDKAEYFSEKRVRSI